MTIYQVINIKVSKGKYEGVDFDNRVFLCYSSEESKYLVGGTNTDSLKIKADDYNYVMRARGYNVADVCGAQIEPQFDRNGYMTDFEIVKSEEE